MDIEAAHSAEAAEKALSNLRDFNNIHTFFRVYSFPTIHCFTDETMNHGMPIVASGMFAPHVVMVDQNGNARSFNGFGEGGNVLLEEEE
tara:strand:- start:7171 stop:7437 length:267 start_codon:yes stop_codon:yes gene_type:complete